ncbi:hypothetical protein KKF38_01710 [Patescibacteria group bacterium]|nr:hypothetical protein [Patescibacteria group bacterium]
MPTDSKDPIGKPKKTSFWRKLSEKQAAGSESCLVNAIVRQAEKEVSSVKNSQFSFERIPEKESVEKEKARVKLANARTLLWFVIIVVAGIWLYFFTMLHESNYFHAKFGKENLITEFNRKTELLQQLRTDNRDTKKFSKLLRVENLVNRVLALDLENPILNYERPEGEQVIPRESSDDSSETLLKTTNSNGEVIYLSEAEIRSLENTRAIRVEFISSALAEILEEAKILGEEIKTDPEIEKELAALLTELAAINPQEKNFPSAVLKSHFAAAQSAAKNILRNVKNANLENLVTDIKNQSWAIDTNEVSETTKEVVANLQTSLDKLSPQRPNSFDIALGEIQALDITKISENKIFQKIVRIIGNPQKEKNDSDLLTAAIIVHNLGRINTINDLRAERIVWSSVIEQAEKIARLGADLERDTGGIPLDASRDIDPNGELVTLLSYSGKSRSGEIDLRGQALGESAYDQKSFTLLADLIDAFEGSAYFKDVSGFIFSKDEDRQGRISSPLNIKLALQDPAVVDSRDIEKTEWLKVKKVDLEEDKKNIDIEALKEIDFSFSNDSATKKDSNLKFEGELTTAEETTEDWHLTAKNDSESVYVFEALRRILNN